MKIFELIDAYFELSNKVRVRVRVRLSKIEVRCASACETIIEVRVCVRHTVNFLATQRLIYIIYDSVFAFDCR